VLGCTAPVLRERRDAIVFVADGRFHLEAIMIANPTIPAYRYDPYQRVLTREEYAHGEMRAVSQQPATRDPETRTPATRNPKPETRIPNPETSNYTL
jgi:2-(3-amino-3-carboxypropyl)histidine synthase